MARRYWLYRMKEIEAKKRKKQLELSRRERRRQVRDEDLNENQRCVVCKSNPREVCVCYIILYAVLKHQQFQIILLPCGHVCLCEDCSDNIIDFCPTCRATIERRSVAYIP